MEGQGGRRNGRESERACMVRGGLRACGCARVLGVNGLGSGASAGAGSPLKGFPVDTSGGWAPDFSRGPDHLRWPLRVSGLLCTLAAEFREQALPGREPGGS